eukprot:CAMPEP_0194529152 /NCGR_PEP_ID=MMETSP0253-20130528/65763_1 /TAXON_ID=2966 /ORGANISM="Noctiluca scintillans" /LENGTH=256 /DNA_ID=CAMNT_0039374269 /DNA_START=1102 /DNA_END=1872 /DNA_ORIENTATION=-
MKDHLKVLDAATTSLTWLSRQCQQWEEPFDAFVTSCEEVQHPKMSLEAMVDRFHERVPEASTRDRGYQRLVVQLENLRCQVDKMRQQQEDEHRPLNTLASAKIFVESEYGLYLRTSEVERYWTNFKGPDFECKMREVQKFDARAQWAAVCASILGGLCGTCGQMVKELSSEGGLCWVFETRHRQLFVQLIVLVGCIAGFVGSKLKLSRSSCTKMLKVVLLVLAALLKGAGASAATTRIIWEAVSAFQPHWLESVGH